MASTTAAAVSAAPGSEAGSNGHAQASPQQLLPPLSEDPAIVAWAQWLADTLARHEGRQEQLAREISAVREAGAVNSAALVDFRRVSHAHHTGLDQQLARLTEDLQATKLELAEVVIEESPNEVIQQVPAKQLRGEAEASMLVAQLRTEVEASMLAVKNHFHELHDSNVQVQRQRLQECMDLCHKTNDLCASKAELQTVKQASEQLQREMSEMKDREASHEDHMRQMDAKFSGHLETIMSHLAKLDKNLHGEGAGILPSLEELKRSLSNMELKFQDSGARMEKLRQDLEHMQEVARSRASDVHKELEPRIFQLEETMSRAATEREHLKKNIRKLNSGINSPSDIADVHVPSSRQNSVVAEAGFTVAEDRGSVSAQPTLRHGSHDDSTSTSRQSALQRRTANAPVITDGLGGGEASWRFQPDVGGHGTPTSLQAVTAGTPKAQQVHVMSTSSLHSGVGAPPPAASGQAGGYRLRPP
eukprot:TRINITY_DN34718_c0_g1_i1.p1 TRINITY_DN34718_c0_g1~~TRINITY_DN34718_c0_g1_i1.p1  ORF type:complete len:475 (-),score=148.97 TRINITY_DN34718_c0_g1_i1:151-1575(-)